MAPDILWYRFWWWTFTHFSVTLTYVPYHYAFYSPSPNLNSFTFILLQSSLYNVKTYEEVKITFTLTISNNSFNTLENVFLDFLVCMYTHKHTQGQRNLHMFFQKHLFFKFRNISYPNSYACKYVLQHSLKWFLNHMVSFLLL